jgi:tetratricopeptide (TPR) repeat protein
MQLSLPEKPYVNHFKLTSATNKVIRSQLFDCPRHRSPIPHHFLNMINASIKQASELNSRGIQFLVEGHSQDAMNAFQSALAGIKEIVSDDNANFDSEGSMSVSPTQRFISESPLIIESLQTDQSFVYNRALVIEEIVSFDDLDSTLALLSAAILFNLALVCHQSGRSGQEKALKRASVLYRMSLQLLQNCEANECTTVICLLALNNRAQIHYELCDYSQSGHCLKQISKIMHDDLRLHESLNAADLEGLLLNVMLQDPPSAARAA